MHGAKRHMNAIGQHKKWMYGDTAVPPADHCWYDHVPIHIANEEFLFLLLKNAIRGVLCFTFDLKINH